MRKAQVTFEITEIKTVANITGVNGLAYKVDITGTKIEKDFTKLLKKLREFQITNEVVESLDINTWNEVKTKNHE